MNKLRTLLDRLKYIHINCMNCGEKVCEYKKRVKNVQDIKKCPICKAKLQIIIGCKLDNFDFVKLLSNKHQTFIINNIINLRENDRT